MGCTVNGFFSSLPLYRSRGKTVSDRFFRIQILIFRMLGMFRALATCAVTAPSLPVFTSTAKTYLSSPTA